MKSKRMAYFDFVFEAKGKGDGWASFFDEYAHWGYWDDPTGAQGTLEELKPSMQRLNEEVLRSARIQDGQSIVDVGCGFGGTLKHVNERHRNMSLLGVEPDDRLCDAARQSVLPDASNQVRFVDNFADNLPCADSSQDRVLAIECIFCFPSREAFLREVMRVLKPGGLLVVSDFIVAKNPPMLRKQKMYLDQLIFRWLGSTSIITLPEYQGLSRDAGFEALLARDITRNTLPTYTSRVAMFRSTGLPLREIGPRIATVRLLELATRLRFLQYQILTFRKGEGRAQA